MTPSEFRIAILECRSISELNRIYVENCDLMDSHRYLYRVLNNHRKLLNQLRRMKVECTAISEMN
jgi:hypothetical protein